MSTETMQAMRERRNALAKETRNLLENNTGKNWNAEHQKKYDEVVADISNIDSELSRRQKLLDIEADKQFTALGGKQQENTDDPKPRALFKKWMARGYEGMSNDEIKIVRNAMSGIPGTNPQEGGYTVESEIVSMVVEKLKLFGGMRAVSEILQTSQGNPLSFPTSDGTAEYGEIVAENASASAADPTFGTAPLNVYKFSSKIIAPPIELLQDSVIDVEQFITTRIASRLGRIQNQMFTTGTGTAQPTGVVTAAGAGVAGATGQTTTVTYNNLVDLVHSLDPAYRQLGNARFMMNDATLGTITKIVDSSGRPIFYPGYLENGATGTPTDRILGYPVQINQDVAVMAASAVSILFGDFSFYKIRDVMNMTIFRFTDSVYTSKGQVGFLAWMRSGGNLIDAGGAVRSYTNSAT